MFDLERDIVKISRHLVRFAASWAAAGAARPAAPLTTVAFAAGAKQLEFVCGDIQRHLGLPVLILIFAWLKPALDKNLPTFGYIAVLRHRIERLG